MTNSAAESRGYEVTLEGDVLELKLSSDERYCNSHRDFSSCVDMDLELYIKEIVTREWGLPQRISEIIYRDWMLAFAGYMQQAQLNFYDLADLQLFRNCLYPPIYLSTTALIGYMLMLRMCGTHNYHDIQVLMDDVFAYAEPELGEHAVGAPTTDEYKVIPAYIVIIEVLGLPAPRAGEYGLTHEDRLAAGVPIISERSDYVQVTGMPMHKD